MYSELRQELDKISDLSGDNFRQVRKLIGLTQVQLGDLLGVNAKTISRIECGYSPVSLPMALSLTFLADACRQKQLKQQALALEIRERDRQAMLRNKESLEAARRRFEKTVQDTRSGQCHSAPTSERVKDPRLSHGSGKRKKKKRR